MKESEALYEAFSEEFARAYKHENAELKQKIWNVSMLQYTKTNGLSGFKRSTIVRAIRILSEEGNSPSSSGCEQIWRWSYGETVGPFAGCNVTVFFSVDTDGIIRKQNYVPGFLQPWVGRKIEQLHDYRLATKDDEKIGRLVRVV